MMTGKTPTYVYHEGYTRELALNSVGEGWAGLVNEAFDALGKIRGDIKILQVKEKYGGLRIYTDYSHIDYDLILINLEKKSFTICELCGEPAKLRNTNGWYRTLCDAHALGSPVVESPF